MNPFFRSPRRLIALGLLWSPFCFGVILLHSKTLHIPLLKSLIFFGPPLVFEVFLCISIWWVCKNAPIEKDKIYESITAHVFASATVTAFWVLIIYLYTRILDTASDTHNWRILFKESFALIVAIGFVLYLIFCFLYYLILAIEKKQAAERLALENELQAARSELRALKTTVNPHFLFNSLTALGELIRTSPIDARRICASLSDFLRYTLRHGEEDMVSVEEEIDHIKSYMEIEKIRFGQRLKYHIRVDRFSKSFRIPPLILLPLVENAVKYGVSQFLEGGEISIDIKKNQSNIQIKVANCYEVSAYRQKGEGIGLETLRRRIAAYYGQDGSLSIEEKNNLFQVRIILPFRDLK